MPVIEGVKAERIEAPEPVNRFRSITPLIGGEAWYVAVRGIGEDDPTGVTYVRIAAWGLVRGTSGRAEHLVAMVADHREHSSYETATLLPASEAYSESMILGIVEPGQAMEIERWQSLAQALYESEQEAKRQEDSVDEAKRIVKSLPPTHQRMLSAIRKANGKYRPSDSGVLLGLIARELVHVSHWPESSDEVRYNTTSLGDVVEGLRTSTSLEPVSVKLPCGYVTLVGGGPVVCGNERPCSVHPIDQDRDMPRVDPIANGSHCRRDPSATGACGGTNESCSCECSTCLPPF